MENYRNLIIVSIRVNWKTLSLKVSRTVSWNIL